MVISFFRTHFRKPASLLATSVFCCYAPGVLSLSAGLSPFGVQDDGDGEIDQGEILGEPPQGNPEVFRVAPIVRVNFEGEGDNFEDLYAGTTINRDDIIQCENGYAAMRFHEGSSLAVAKSSRMKVESLFEEGKPDEARFNVEYGCVRARSNQAGRASIKIVTPNGVAVVSSDSDVTIELERGSSVEMRVYSGNATFANNVDAINVHAGERLTVGNDKNPFDAPSPFSPDSDPPSFPEPDWDTGPASASNRGPGDLDGNAYLETATYANLTDLAPEIRNYGRSLESYGEWIDVSDVGLCWRPSGVGGDWQPYANGHWSNRSNGMTWVSYDPFGYVTHHYGRWGWDPLFGWYWIPGVFYSPAWVAWNITDSYFGWAPLGYHNRPIYWGRGSSRHDCWHVVPMTHIHEKHIYRHVRWDKSIARSFPSYNRRNSRTHVGKRGPLIVTRREFHGRNPQDFRNALKPQVASQRIKAYEARAGVYGRPRVIRDTAPVPVARRSPERPFEDAARRSLLPESARPGPAPPARRAAESEPGHRSAATPSRATPGDSAPPRRPGASEHTGAANPSGGSSAGRPSASTPTGSGYSGGGSSPSRPSSSTSSGSSGSAHSRPSSSTSGGSSGSAHSRPSSSSSGGSSGSAHSRPSSSSSSGSSSSTSGRSYSSSPSRSSSSSSGGSSGSTSGRSYSSSPSRSSSSTSGGSSGSTSGRSYSSSPSRSSSSTSGGSSGSTHSRSSGSDSGKSKSSGGKSSSSKTSDSSTGSRKR